ncbi:MAG: thymidylate synthase, partial [Myxococcota bacterium]
MGSGQDVNDVSGFIARSREGVESSTATPQAKATVSEQLSTVQARFEAGDLSPEHAIEQTKIWNAWADDAGDLETAYGRFWRRFPVP